MPRRRSSSVDEGYDFVSWTRMKANIRRFCANKFWCKAKLFASFIVVLDVLVTAWKWAYLQTRPEAYRLAIHVAEKVLYPYWFATLIVDGLYIYYGIMDEYVWAMKMYVFNNIVHVILLDILLLVELIVILEYGHEAPWTHLSVSMTTLQMVLITLWHPFAIYMARRIELGIYARWRDQTLTCVQLWCPRLRKT